LNAYGIVGERAKSSKGEIIVHTYASKLRNLYIPIPPLEEQKHIETYLKVELFKIDKAIELQQLQINKQKEYKATLINSAVTGKIKVV
jgi:type I restriction enzyme S subunit